ncbi:MAG TPA: type II toxin-antitoxin system VapC family toxin [Candidatus Dormibacteraeota bacterium]|nr:type II toxin-antitoxin system VapC family toxin [Candidatus Dormibacteraeota bacterium]
MSQARLVIDASAVVALLADDGPAGRWVTASVAGADLAAPELMPYEAANILRRQELAGVLDPTAASLAHRDLTALPLQLCPYAPLAARAWELRRALTTYEASYVALAELLGAPLVTLDARLGRALGPRCSVLAYGGP